MTLKFAPHMATFLVVASLGGCATAIEGTSQDISVVTNPAGATCVLERDGKTIGTVQATPGISRIEKSRYDITIRCNKEGFQEAVLLDKSDMAAASAGSFVADALLTQGAAGAVDSVSGADNNYDSPVNLTLLARTATPTH